MARSGRAQPKAPIYLRGALAGFIVATSAAPQIHVIQAEPHKPTAGHVYVLRAPFAPPPTVQIHVVSLTRMRVWQHPARDADVTFVRPPVSSVVPDRLAPQSHVISLVDARTPTRGRHASVSVIRNALVPPSLASGNAPQIRVQGVNRRERLSPATHVTLLRNALVPPPLAAGNPVQILVVSPNWRVSHPARDADVTQVRPSVTSLVPDRLCPQIHVVALKARRPRPRTLATFKRNPAVIVPDRLPPQSHVFLWHRRRPDPPAHIVQERNPMVPPLVRAETVYTHGTIYPVVQTVGAIPSPIQTSGSCGRYVGDSITRTYTMALDNPETSISSTLLDVSGSPGMG